jgi:competence ComEA-like helix-hairpin-helix protein
MAHPISSARTVVVPARPALRARFPPTTALPVQRARRLFATALLFALLGVFLSPGFATKKPPARPVNLNSANSAELQQVPGIGPATAEKILQMRKSYGAFKNVDDLLAIRGIGKKRLDKMRKYLAVGKPAASHNPTTAQNLSTPAKCANCPKTAVVPAKQPSERLAGVAKGKSSSTAADSVPKSPTKSTTPADKPADARSAAAPAVQTDEEPQ